MTKMGDYPALTDKALRMSYRIARGEQGVLTFEPYKSMILPLWRFRTVPIAKKSATELWAKFEDYNQAGDFVGLDMTRKFIQMGMTRAKRYANHKGGRKYNKDTGVELEKSKEHTDHNEKLEASEIFKVYWRRCVEDEGYLAKKEAFLKEQKEWDKTHKKDKDAVQAVYDEKVRQGKMKQNKFKNEDKYGKKEDQAHWAKEAGVKKEEIKEEHIKQEED